MKRLLHFALLIAFLLSFLLCSIPLLPLGVTFDDEGVDTCCTNTTNTLSTAYTFLPKLPGLVNAVNKNDPTICVIFFYDPACRECQLANENIDNLKSKYPTLRVQEHNPGDEWDLLQRYCDTYNVSLKGTFAIFIGTHYYYDLGHFGALEDNIKAYLEKGVSCPQLTPDEDGEETLEGVTIFAVITGGLIDGINPCAFATLIFFIAYLERVKQGRRTLLYIGLAFSLAVFVGYIVVGLGILEFYYQAEGSVFISDIIYFAAALLALLLAFFNIYDYFRVKKDEEPILQLPRFLKKRRGRIIRVLTGDYKIVILALLAFLVGLGIALLEFVCTGQVLFPVLAVIKNASPERFTAYLYLILYNIMFILPLLLILALFYIGYKSDVFGEILKNRQGTIKILTALFLLVIGIYMLTIVL